MSDLKIISYISFNAAAKGKKSKVMPLKSFNIKFFVCSILLLCIAYSENESLASDFYERTLPGQQCKIDPLNDWTRQEKWVWKQVCEGNVANFNSNPEFGGNLNPNNPENWRDHENRVLTSRFLRTILFYDPFRNAHTERGTRIVGAWFKDKINLFGGNVSHNLWITYSLFESDVDLSDITAVSTVIFGGSAFYGKLRMQRINIEGSLLLRYSTISKEFEMRGAKIGGQVLLSDSIFKGNLILASTRIDESLLIDGARLEEVLLRGAKIGGQLSMIGSTFEGTLDLDSAKIGFNLLMSGSAKFKDVILRSTEIGDQLSMNGSTFEGMLNMNGVKIDGSLLMRFAIFLKPQKRETNTNRIGMEFIKVNGNIDLRGSKLPSIDLLGGIIGGILFISESNYTSEWLPSSELDLRFSKVVRVLSQPNLPDLKSVRLDGFQYNALGGYRDDNSPSKSSNPSVFFIKEWLSKSPERPGTPSLALQILKQIHAAILRLIAKNLAFTF